MIALAEGQTIDGESTSAAEVTYTVTGSSTKKGVSSYSVLAQGQLAASAETIYKTPGEEAALVSHILLSNNSGSEQTVSLYVGGTTAAHRIVQLKLPGDGSATFDRDGWKVYDASGRLLSVGEPGPEGPPGPEGVGDLHYVFTEGAPSEVWTIKHELGKFPSVTVIDTAEDAVEGAVVYLGNKELTITFSAPVSGVAYLN